LKNKHSLEVACQFESDFYESFNNKRSLKSRLPFGKRILTANKSLRFADNPGPTIKARFPYRDGLLNRRNKLAQH
jgi:hypothetical protein